MFSNRTPSFDIRSIWGVFNAGWPAQLMAFHRISSHRMKSTFGLFSAAKPLEHVRIEVTAPIQNAKNIGGTSFNFMSKNAIYTMRPTEAMLSGSTFGATLRASLSALLAPRQEDVQASIPHLRLRRYDFPGAHESLRD